MHKIIDLEGYVKIRTVLEAIQNSTHPLYDDEVTRSWENHMLGVVLNIPPENIHKKGTWIYNSGVCRCSECGHEFKVNTHLEDFLDDHRFCGCCGADTRVRE